MSAPPRDDTVRAVKDGAHGRVLAAPYRRLTVGIVATVVFIAFEGMAVATVMPVAVADLGGIATYASGFTAFLITSLVGMVAGGDVCDARGPRLPFLVSGAVFGAGLLLAGLAPTMSVFVAGRAVQGLGMGVAIVCIYVVVGRAYPEELRPRAFSAISSAWVLPSLIGPAVAGWLAENVSWRWAFLGVVPVIVPAMLLVVPALSGIGAAGASGATGTAGTAGTAGRSGPAGRSRAAGGAASRRGRTRLAIAAACGVALLQYAGQRLTIASVLVALAALAVLWSSVPRLLPTGTLRAARGLPTTVLMRGLLAGAFFGAEAFVPLMLVQERQLGPGQAGLALTGAALGWSAGSWYQGRPQLPIPRHRLVQLGCWLVGVAIALTMVVVVMAVTPWVAALAWVVGGLGMGLAMASVGVLVLEQSPIADQGANSAALQVSDALLSTIMIGVGGALFAALHVRPGSDTPAFVAIYAVMLAVALLGAALATRVRTPLTRAPGDDTR